LFRNAVLNRQIKRSENYIPKRKLDAIIARVPISFRYLRGMVPPVHLRGDEQIIQEPCFYVTTTMRKDPRDERGRCRYNKRQRVEPNNP
jgi:hypothetical protein